MEESKDLATHPVAHSSIFLPVSDSVFPAASPTSLVNQPQVNEKEAAMATDLLALEASVTAKKVQGKIIHGLFLDSLCLSIILI